MGKPSPKAIVCKVCTKEFKQLTDLQKHMRHHAAPKMFDCANCDSSFTSPALLEQHIETHLKMEALECSECGDSFSDENSYKRHLATHGSGSSDIKESALPSSKELFRCIYCPRTFNMLRNLKCHERVHFKKSKTPSPKKVSRKKSLFLTNIKQEPVTEQQILKGAMNIDDPPELENIYPCSVCSKKFLTSYDLRRHEKKHIDCLGVRKYLTQIVKCSNVAMGTGYVAYRCPTCEKLFDTTDKLESHILSEHWQVKMLTCNLCDVSFADKTTYQEHLKGHKSQTMYKCQKCDRSFNLLKNLKSHEKAHEEFELKYNLNPMQKTVFPSSHSVNKGKKNDKIQKKKKNGRQKKISPKKAPKNYRKKPRRTLRYIDSLISSSNKTVGNSLKTVNTEECNQLEKDNVNASSKNPIVVQLSAVKPTDPPLIYLQQPPFNVINAPALPNIQMLTSLPKTQQQSNLESIPEFNCDSEEYITWLKGIINKCKLQMLPLPQTLTKIVGQVNEDLFSALFDPEGSMKKKENHFHMMKFYQTMSDIMMRHVKHYLEP